MRNHDLTTTPGFADFFLQPTVSEQNYTVNCTARVLVDHNPNMQKPIIQWCIGTNTRGYFPFTRPRQDKGTNVPLNLDPFIQTQVLRKPDPIYLVIYSFNTYLLNITYGCILSRMCSKYWDTAGVKQIISALIDFPISSS